MDLNDINKQWACDCTIDPHNLFEASRSTANLHAKYLQMYSIAKLQLRKVENDQKTLLKDKWMYYNGKMHYADVDARGWKPDPFDGLKIMKGEMDYYYDADVEIQASEDKVQYYKVVVDTLKEIIDNIKWRHQTIKNMIDWRKFEDGS